jgi:hypothetical protein
MNAPNTNSSAALVRQLRDLDPVGEPNTTKQIGKEAADLVASLKEQVERLRQEKEVWRIEAEDLRELDANAEWVRLDEDNSELYDRIQTLEATNTTLRAELAKAREAKPEPMFPIMGGPKVPWSLIEPYDEQARKNHSQTLKRLAERGGLSMCEAMAIMSNASYDKRPLAKPTVEDWLDFIAVRKRRADARASLASQQEGTP